MSDTHCSWRKMSNNVSAYTYLTPTGWKNILYNGHKPCFKGSYLNTNVFTRKYNTIIHLKSIKTAIFNWELSQNFCNIQTIFSPSQTVSTLQCILINEKHIQANNNDKSFRIMNKV